MPKKDGNVKKVSKTFMPWKFEEEPAWLEEMAREGWLLEKHGLNYHFVKTEPVEMVYRTDYYSITSKKKMEEYKTIFEESSWEFVDSSTGWHYYRIPAESFDTDIYSDPQSRIDQLKRVNQDTFSIFILYFILFVIIKDFESWFDLVLFIPMLACLIWGFFYILKIRDKIKILNALLDEEDRVSVEH